MKTPHAKVLVLGPGEAGKSTLVATLCRDAVNLSVRGRTVALDHGTVEHRGRVFHFFGVPGQARFAPVQESLLKGCQVAVVVRRAGELLDPLTIRWCGDLAARGVPLILVTNLVTHGKDGDHLAGKGLFAACFEINAANPSEAERILPMLFRLVEKEEQP